MSPMEWYTVFQVAVFAPVLAAVFWFAWRDRHAEMEMPEDNWSLKKAKKWWDEE